MDEGCLGQFRCRGALRMALTGCPPGLAIGGDVDEYTYPALVEMLDELAQGRDEVHVDLSAVEFCDLAGLRAIVRLATARRTVVLHGLPAQHRTVLSILGWDGTPGLVIDNKPSGLSLPPAGRDPVLLSEPRETSNASTRRHEDAR
jgi:anti-anti-sigma regulatory factor